MAARAARPAARPGQDQGGRTDGGDDDDHAQPRVPPGVAAEQDPGPGGGDRQRGGHGGRANQVWRDRHADGADADERADRGGERDGIVRVVVPDMKLSTSPATTSQPPHRMAAARVRSVRRRAAAATA